MWEMTGILSNVHSRRVIFIPVTSFAQKQETTEDGRKAPVVALPANSWTKVQSANPWTADPIWDRVVSNIPLWDVVVVIVVEPLKEFGIGPDVAKWIDKGGLAPTRE
jgi:hypothetical protein